MRYVIFRHESIEQPHYDLMFETAPGSALATWRSPVWPLAGSIVVQRLPDHRAAYLEYEGEISGGRGRVRRVEQGTCQFNRTDEELTIRLTPAPAGQALVLRITLHSAGAWLCTPL